VHAVLGRLFGGHPEWQTSINELGTVLEDAGFSDIRTGPTSFKSVSFVEALS